MRSLSRLSILVSVVAAMSFLALAPLQAGRKKHEGSHHRKKEHTMHKKEKMACPAGKKGAHCASPKECAAKLDGVLTGLKAAQEALKEGETDEASKKLAAAIEHLEMCQKWMKKHSATAAGKPVNTACPIMDGKVDPDNTPAKLTRTFQGKTIGFCCAGCPPKWDKLSDEEKAEKLKKVMEKQ
jgi:hypothetical protein